MKQHRIASRLGPAFARAGFAAALGLVLWTVEPPCALAAETEPTAAEKETARSLMRSGDEHFQEGRFAQALQNYQAADAIMKVPTTGLAVGKAQERLGRWVEARDAWLSVLRYPETPGEPVPFSEARREAATLAQNIAERIPSLNVEVLGVEPGIGVDVFVDDVAVRVANVDNKFNPGTHQVRVEAEGYVTETLNVTLAASQQETLQVRLQPEAPVAAAVPPPPKPKPQPPVSQDPMVEDTGTGNRKTAMWFGFGVGAAGVTVGTIFGLSSLSDTEELLNQCPGDRCPEELADEIDDATFKANVANVGFIVGAVGLGFGLWELWQSDEAQVGKGATRLSVSASGVQVDGSF